MSKGFVRCVYIYVRVFVYVCVVYESCMCVYVCGGCSTRIALLFFGGVFSGGLLVPGPEGRGLEISGLASLGTLKYWSENRQC